MYTCVLIHLILTVALWGRHCYASHVTGEETETQLQHKGFVLWIMLLPSTQWSLWSINGDVGEEDFQWHGNHTYGFQLLKPQRCPEPQRFCDQFHPAPDWAQRSAPSSGKSLLPPLGLHTLFFLLPGLSHDKNSHRKWVHLVFSVRLDSTFCFITFGLN